MRFANPQLLWLLLLVPPAVILFLWWAWRKRLELMKLFIQARLLPNLTVGLSPRRQKMGFALLVLAFIFLILALARPQWGFSWEEARLRGLDIVVGVDVSKSMLAEDVPPNRLARARLAVLDLVRQAQSDRLGLVAFAGDAFLQCPLTIDEAAFRQTLDALEIGVIPQGGTAIAAAIRTAMTAFKEGDSYKVLVLFSDGEDHDSGAVQAAREAAEKGLKIFTIGIGTPEGEILRDRDRKGRIDYIRDPEGNVVKSRLNEEMLREIAEATDGGFYLPLRGSQTVETLYSQGLSRLPKSDRQEKLLKRYHERYHWPLAIAIFLLLAEFFLTLHQAQSSVARRRTAPASPGLKAVATAVIALAVLFQTASASADTALRDYRAGRYDDALRKYRDRLDRKNPDPRLHFNAGASAYRDGKLKDALEEFSEALKSPDLNLQQSTYYNRGNTQFYLGQEAEDPSKRGELWKKSIQDFGSAVKLNPNDQDAKFNQELVKKMLEELQQQQPPQQSPDNQDQKKEDQQKQQQQQSNSGQDQQQEKNESQSQDQQTAQSQQEQQEQQKQDQPSQQAQQESQPQPNSDQQEQPQPSSGQDQQETQQSEAAKQAGAPAQPGQMTPEQARRLLDSQEAQEKALPIPHADAKKKTPANRPFKDW